MNRRRLELLVIACGSMLFALGAAAAMIGLEWLQLPVGPITLATPDHAVLALLAVMIVVGGCLWALITAVRAYAQGAERIADETKLIVTANAAHHLEQTGPIEMRDLAAAINSFADRFRSVLTEQQAKIEQARSELEAERNRLAALMSELSEGVLVCTLDGRILLYNSRARALLEQESTERANGDRRSFVGLGRSVFGLIERDAISHALEYVRSRIEQQSVPVSRFVTTASNGQLLRVNMAPVVDQERLVSGYVLTLENITQQLATSRRRDKLLQSLTEGMRAPLANIRAAIETIKTYPQMDPARLDRFRNVISQEAETLSERLDQTLAQHTGDLKAQWQFDEISASDLLRAIQRASEDKLQITTRVEEPEEQVWLKLDSYIVVQACTALLRQLKQASNVDHVVVRLEQQGRFAACDLCWHGTPHDVEVLQDRQAALGAQGTTTTVREVAEQHGGEVWYQADGDLVYVRLLLPTTQPRPVANVQISAGSRPEYYDFDLFRQTDQRPELDQARLTELSYTVFDTETTGLSPSEGDEIISISAVRIVNGRLLQHEVFDQLIDPCRPIPRASIAVHGIAPHMVQGQPTIEQVLPQFRRFAEDTVLVGHNAAFDMRFLQLKESRTGVSFPNPVLDTLLLAAVVFPEQQKHSLEELAKRLGVDITGRHTSLGDAIVTAEVFLKLIPLLESKGIATLSDARAAAQHTFYARFEY